VAPDPIDGAQILAWQSRAEEAPRWDFGHRLCAKQVPHNTAGLFIGLAQLAGFHAFDEMRVVDSHAGC
jgi:hypothetical protein